MQKFKFEFDPHNRLVVTSSGLRGVRKVLDGQFKVSANNVLSYHVKSPIPNEVNAPHQVKLKGEWSLTKGHQLRLTLDKWRRRTFGDEITLQGELLDAGKNSLLFAVAGKSKDGAKSIYTLELAGEWQADKHNRLAFRVNKERGASDLLTFNGAWEVNKNFQIVYNYQKNHSLLFKGYWDIKDKARIFYLLGSDPGSGFEFTTGAGIFKDKYIKYEVGIGVSQKKRPIKRIIAFTGGWKLNKKVGLVFEVRVGNKKIQELIFGAKVQLTDKGLAEFKLRNSRGEGLGAELELSRDIFKGDGQAFLRLLRSRRESAILAGAGWRW